jgi:hypothetical protein
MKPFTAVLSNFPFTISRMNRKPASQLIQQVLVATQTTLQCGKSVPKGFRGRSRHQAPNHQDDNTQPSFHTVHK